jgi:glycopeptide antibiotics resistance protein
MQNSLQQKNDFKLNPRWLLAGLLVLIGAALFPYGLIPLDRILSFSPEVSIFVERILSSWQAHVIGHAAIFMMMGTAVLLRFPSLLNRPKIYLGIMFVLGVLQEFFQIVGFKHRAIVFDDIFDVFVDIIGALIAFFVLRLILKIIASSTSSR